MLGSHNGRLVQELTTCSKAQGKTVLDALASGQWLKLQPRPVTLLADGRLMHVITHWAAQLLLLHVDQLFAVLPFLIL
jgi:hypothetical protein